MKKRFLKTVAATLLLLHAGALSAVENIQLNGFFTVGAAVSNSNTTTQNGNISDDVGFEEDTRVGVQISADINKRMSVTAQLLGASDQGQAFDAKFDWGYVSYSLSENIDLRGGKIKFPTFLISEYIEVGYAYPWIRPPAEVYSSNPITAITGADLLLRMRVGDGDLLLQPYFGTANDEEALVPQEVLPAPGMPAGSVNFANFDAKNMAGINVAYSGRAGTLRAGYLQTEVSATDFGITDSEDVTFWSVGGNLDWNNIIVYSEYFEREIDGAANAFFPSQKGWYTTLGYRIGLFLPHITYANLDDNSSSGDLGIALEQESLTVGLRYELGKGAALKLEAQRIEPKESTRGLLISPVDDINVYSIAVDVIF
ncbi:hypothetical protein MNBD_GAMMA15-1289 [hydrothermal vent metagenome]|uniref:Porin domain-containing protein n=1 Tax=hydrothermal vent metagenome TaxID=652676 RepID=A0A3B0XYH7_9ZZZZ